MSRSIRAIRLACRDVEATVAFYVAAFGCVAETGDDGPALRLGAQRMEFGQAVTDGGGAPPRSTDTAFQHCAIIVTDMAEAMDRLRGVSGWSAISSDGPETLPAASGGATAFKFRDPEGHPLELLQFPTGAVPAVWAERGGGPFLGIDHSAITVADADRSIAFYESLGFRLAGRQWNRGAEQGRLDGLGPDAAVEVVSLRPTGGAPPHLELLCYRAPAVEPAPAPDGSPFATVLRLSGDMARDGTISDPDGHRLS